MKLSSAQKEQFQSQGYLYLPEALDKKTVQPIKNHILKELEKQKIWARGRVLSGRWKGIPAFQQVNKLGQAITYPSLREELVTRSVYSMVREVSDVPLTQEQDAKLLISLPKQGDWTLTGLSWHRDISEPKSGKMPGVQIFVLLDNLSPRGGATLALAGSHRLSGQSRSQQSIEKLLEEAPPSGIEVDGIKLSIHEMSGKMGDVYLMDMRLLHTPSINASNTPRLMATLRFFGI